MSDYGKNFGFRRSEPAVREGRLGVPATGDFLQGDIVTYDPAAPGKLKRAAAGAPVVGGFTGLLIQEEGWDVSVFGAQVHDSNNKGKALNGKPAVLMTGAGLKVWLKNTAEVNYHGRVFPAVTRVNLTGVAIGDELQWTGSAYAKKSTGAGVLRVTAIGDGYVEAVLLG
jgi:hypothetical protein